MDKLNEQDDDGEDLGDPTRASSFTPLGEEGKEDLDDNDNPFAAEAAERGEVETS